MKKYESYKDSGVEWIGEIPSGWFSTPLKRIVSIGNGKDYKHIEVEEGGYPVLGTGGVFSRCSEYLHIGPSVLLGRKGTIDNPLFIEEPFWTSDTIYYTVIDEDKVIPKLLYHLVHQIPFELFSYGSAIPSMTKTHYEEMRFPFPPLSEQQQIVFYLDTKTSQIDSLIEKTQRKIQLLKENRTSLINEVVTKGLNPNVEMKDSGVEWIGEIPSHWFCVGTNKVYHDLGTGTTPTSDNTEYYDESGHHWITTTDLNEGIMYDTLTKITDKSLEDYPNLRLYPSGSIFISMYGGRIGKLGVSTFESYCNQSVCVLPKNDKINVKFYYYWFLGFQELVKNMGRGGGQPNINKDMIKQFPTVKLSLTEQQQIVSYLDEHTQLIDKTISVEERRIDTLKEYRQSLISEVVTGKRKVTTDE
jgi:type I restriction enzyme S subunit